MNEPTFLPATDSDLDGLVNLLRACDEVDIGAPDTNVEDVHWRWRTPEFQRRTDSWIAKSSDEPIAYGFVFEGEAEGWVHPNHRGRGVGTALLKRIEERAVEQGSPDGILRQNVTSLDPSGLELMKNHGYTESHHYARMEMVLDDKLTAPPVPEGIEIANFRTGEEREVYDAYVAAWSQYEPHWRDEGFERWSQVFDESDFDPSLWFIARRDGKIVAFNLTYTYPEIGWVQSLGTVPSERGHGLGALLLDTSLAEFRARGLSRAGLTVSSRNLPQARRLYERAGMRELLRYINLAKPLDAL